MKFIIRTVKLFANMFAIMYRKIQLIMDCQLFVCMKFQNNENKWMNNWIVI